jgi:hypothetical protein
LGEYFVDTDRMRFEYLGSPNNAIPGPGIYSVSVDVNFTDRAMKWFENSSPTARITVSLDKTSDASPASPFYYYPLDGEVGRQKGRIGYGTNFTLETPDEAFPITDSADQSFVTKDVPGSVPAASAKALRLTDFATLNTQNRGRVFSVNSNTGEWTLSPSLATPVMLKTNASTAVRDAFAFYSVEVDSQPQTNVSYLSRWSGISPACKDFAGDGLDKYAETPDVSGLSAKCAALGQNEATTFGFEWCNRKLAGSVTLQTVFFTPPGKQSILTLWAKNASAEFTALQGTGDKVELNGVPGMAQNAPSDPITSVQDVLDLVKQGKVCVTGSQNAGETDFFWNPKVILDGLAAQRDAASKACIKG